MHLAVFVSIRQLCWGTAGDEIYVPRCDHLGDAHPARRLQPVPAGVIIPVEKEIQHFVDGDVQHPVNQSLPHALFQGSAPGPNGVEDDGFVAPFLQKGLGAADTSFGGAQIAYGDQGLGCLLWLDFSLDHAHNSPRCIGQDLPGHTVETRNVGHRVEHGDILGAHVGAGVPGGHGRDHELGHAEG